jgi:hypothetical protein
MKVLLILVFFLLIIGFISCSKNEDDTGPLQWEFKTNTGKSIFVTETHPEGQSLSNIEIRTEGFLHNISETFVNKDPITDIFISDLDGNGFDEIYIVTSSQGSGSYGGVLAFASNKDLSMSMINFPDIKENPIIFDGYMGHDVFTIEDQGLVRTFPVYKNDDTNQNPTGGKRKVIYKLAPGEAMWQLKIFSTD